MLAVAMALCFATVTSYARKTRPRTVVAGAHHSPRSAHAEGIPRGVLAIVGYAFILRLIIGALLSEYGFDALVAPDAGYYRWMGDYLARLWAATGTVNATPFLREGQLRFALLNGLASHVFGFGEPFMLLLTASAGAWTALTAWRIANRLAGGDAARYTLLLTAFFPSLVLWSALDLRDPFLVLAVTGVAWATLELKDGWRTTAAIRLALWCVGIGLFRDYLLLMMAAAAAIGFVGGSSRHLVRDALIGVVLIALIGLMITRLGLGQERVTSFNLERLSRTRMGFSILARSGYLFGAETGTVRGALSFLPLGIAYSLYGPFPWQARGLLQLLTVPEMLFWYWLTPRVWSGIRDTFRRDARLAWVVLAFVTVLVLLYALLSGNVGTAYRHRAQVLPLFMVFAGAGWAARGKRRRRFNLRGRHHAPTVADRGADAPHPSPLPEPVAP